MQEEQKGLVSIVIPLYNAEDYIAETLQTVIDQSYTNFEVIIVNDGSMDNSLQVIRDQFSDDRIKIIDKENEGVSITRNKGFAASKGEYIAFLDADDTWHKDFLKDKVEVFEARPEVGCVLAYLQVIDGVSKPVPFWYRGMENDAMDAILRFESFASTSPSNLLLRRSVVEKLGGFDDKLSNAADKYFYLKITRLTQMYCIPKVLMYYRVHEGSMHQNIDLMIRDYLKFRSLIEEEDFIDKKQSWLYLFGLCKIFVFEALNKKHFGKAFKFIFLAFIKSPILFAKTFFSKSVVRKLAFNTLYKIGFHKYLISKARSKGKLPIALFHRVDVDYDPSWPPIPPNEFFKLIEELNKYYKFISLKDLWNKDVQDLKEGISIVFDDGYKDYFDFVKPTLDQFKVPTTIFVPTDCIDKEENIWTSKIDFAVKTYLEQDSFDTLLQKIQSLTSFKNVDSIEKAKQTLSKEDKASFHQKLDEFMSIFDDQDKTILMKWDELKSIDNPNVEIQSHTCSHYYLSSFKNDSDIEHELVHSKNRIEENLNKKCDFIAYPIGGYNEKVKEITEQYYKAGFAVDNHLVDISKIKQGDKDYLYQIPRINMYGDHYKEMLFRAIGFHEWIKSLIFWR